MDSIINLQKKIVPELTDLLVQRYQILRQVSHESPIGRRALAGKLGLSAKELPLVKGKMVDAVEAGHPVILALGKGDFTSSGHYIVLTGWVDGAFTVNDPNSRVRSGKQWTYEELEGQIRNIWEISK